ncbi:FAD-binding domain-containing protein [Punctularia strigosozonata HHB-11173 SS5]|uniref:FAD-binding domain-containing protein n=1 Tax=Punctularia strigosozonata (strain HHB-11173) TaxID=741275 RepID=UPI000441812D|nr:FAD-binding domain-containing protein [Punctularia strigosozonata HHB-11173 SS5]EIN11996.1 FAD-binding domain-containing protein [Punctularia strigosozonata HHB-11173 SS5]
MRVLRYGSVILVARAASAANVLDSLGDLFPSSTFQAVLNTWNFFAGNVSDHAPPNLSACRLIAGRISDASAVFYPDAVAYETDMVHAFGSSAQNATCSVQPANAQDVAEVVNVLSEMRVPWAIKSGGHASNPGWSSTPGVQITLSRINATTFDAATRVATVGAGARWETVYAALDPYNASVAGGRVSGVGVGGFVLGGGYSWFTNQVGLTIDTVVEFELVTLAGDILTVNNETYPDLFFGLKGGGNNFGVVTQIKMKTHQQGPVYGGMVIVDAKAMAQAHKEVSKFQDSTTDPRAAMAVIYGFNHALGGLFGSFFLFYDGPTPPEGLFDGLLSLPAVSKDIHVRSMSTLIGGLSGPAYSPRGAYRALAVKNYTVPMLEHIAGELTVHASELFAHTGTQFMIAIEPMLDSIFSHHAGQPTALIHDDGDFFAPTVLLATWDNAAEDKRMLDILKAIDDSIVEFGVKAGQKIGPGDAILYPNYASIDTHVENFFGRNLPELRRIQEKYDPHGLTKLTGGWKFA